MGLCKVDWNKVSEGVLLGYFEECVLSPTNYRMPRRAFNERSDMIKLFLIGLSAM